MEKVLELRYPVSVDYNVPLADMIKAGNYGWVSRDITNYNFPVKKSGKVELNLQFVHSKRDVSSPEIATHLKDISFRPATLFELLAFGMKYPEVHREFPIIALGSLWRNSDGFVAAPLFGISKDYVRELKLQWIGFDWSNNPHFLVVFQSLLDNDWCDW